MSRSLPLVLTLLCFAACSGKNGGLVGGNEVNLAIWGNYLSPELQARFTQETGIKINISNYSSNEELLAKTQAGASGYDVAVPSDYMVDIMVKQGMLQTLDKSKIPNSSGVSAEVLKQAYDPENSYSFPYAWGTAGIAVNREVFKGKIESWKDLFTNPELKGKFSLLDDVRESMGAALKLHGYSVNTMDDAELAKAKATLVDARKRVKMFTSDIIDPLVNKEIAVAHAWSTDALQAAERTGGKIEYILPKEGGTRSIDNIVIFKNAKHVEAAHKLINFLLSTDVNVEFVTKMRAGPVLDKTRALLPPELRESPSLFPNPKQLAKFERLLDLGPDTAKYERIWTELKIN